MQKLFAVFRPQKTQRKQVHIYILKSFNLARVKKSLFGGISLIFNPGLRVCSHALLLSFTLLLGDLMLRLVQQTAELRVWWIVTINLPLDHIPEVVLMGFRSGYWNGHDGKKPVLWVGEHYQSRRKQVSSRMTLYVYDSCVLHKAKGTWF